MFDQYNKFCIFTFIANLHIKNICLAIWLSLYRHGTNDINELRKYFRSHSKDMSVVYGNLFRWGLRAVNIRSTRCWWRWIQNQARLHQLCTRRSDDIMVSSVRALERAGRRDHKCWRARMSMYLESTFFWFKEWNLTYISNDIRDLGRRCYANSF